MNSSEYFAKRSEARMKRMHDKAAISMAKINKSFDDSIKRLKEEINHIVGNVDGLSATEVNTHMLKKIDYDRYKELLQQYHRTTNPRIRSKLRNMLKENAASYRIERKEALIRAIEAEKLRQVDTQLSIGEKHLTDVYKTVNRELGTPDVDTERLKEVLNHEWAGSNFSKRVWHNQEVLADNIKENLMQSFISGKSNRQIADELEFQTNMGRYAANRLIRTETSYMVNSADLDSSKKRGIKAKKFEANLDSRTSKICREHNQKIILIDKIEIGKNAPPLHPFCRSFLADVLEGWDYETDEELQALVNENNVDSTEGNIHDLKEEKGNDIIYSNMSDSEIDKFFYEQETYKKWKENLSEEDKEIINYYTMSEHVPINNISRRGYDKYITDAMESFNNDPEELHWVKLRANEYFEKGNKLEKALQGYETEKAFITYRGTTGKPEYFKDLILGKEVILDKGFLSTSLMEEVTEGFIEGYNVYKFEITVPKGYKNGAFIKEFSDIQEEQEFLFQRGSKFKVLEIDDSDGVRNVKLEAINDKK